MYNFVVVFKIDRYIAVVYIGKYKVSHYKGCESIIKPKTFTNGQIKIKTLVYHKQMYFLANKCNLTIFEGFGLMHGML